MKILEIGMEGMCACTLTDEGFAALTDLGFPKGHDARLKPVAHLPNLSIVFNKVSRPS